MEGICLLTYVTYMCSSPDWPLKCRSRELSAKEIRIGNKCRYCHILWGLVVMILTLSGICTFAFLSLSLQPKFDAHQSLQFDLNSPSQNDCIAFALLHSFRCAFYSSFLMILQVLPDLLLPLGIAPLYLVLLLHLTLNVGATS